MHHSIRSTISALLIIWLFAVANPVIRAQDSATTATLTGTVHDTAGAVISGTKINLRNPATNQTRSIVSEGDGSYRVAALPVGVYEVRVGAEGFQPHANATVTHALRHT